MERNHTPVMRRDHIPVKCESCGWRGQEADCFRYYEGFPVVFIESDSVEWDTELRLFCPKCGSDQLSDNDQLMGEDGNQPIGEDNNQLMGEVKGNSKLV